MDWEALAPSAGNSVEVGFQLVATSQDPADITPSSIAIASTQCAVTRVYSAGGAAPPPARTTPPPPPHNPPSHAFTHAQALRYAEHEFGEAWMRKPPACSVSHNQRRNLKPR